MTDHQGATLVSHSSFNPDQFESRAIALAKEGKCDEAELAFREALRLKPDHAQVLNNYGVFLQEQGKYEQAVTQLRRAATLAPRAADVHNNLGVSLSVGRVKRGHSGLFAALSGLQLKWKNGGFRPVSGRSTEAEGL